jgi:Zn-finger nucleic acid-binding protein
VSRDSGHDTITPRPKEDPVSEADKTEARCPRCDHPLEKGTFHDVELEKCTECQGLLISNRVLTPLLEAMTRELVDTINPELDLDPVPDKGPSAKCPRCQGEMEHYGYMGGNQVMIDGCTGCVLIWLDAEELAAMSQLFAKTTRSSVIRKEASDKRIEQISRRFDAVMAGRKLQRRLMRGFRRFF